MRRKRVTRTAIVCLALCTGFGIAQAQDAPGGAWRCGSTYTDRPCAGGKALAFDAGPSADQVREAERSTRSTEAAADRMERERLRRERSAPSPLIHLAKPNAVSPAEPAHPAAKKKKGRKEPDFFTAAGPGTPKKKKAEKTDAGS